MIICCARKLHIRELTLVFITWLISNKSYIFYMKKLFFVSFCFACFLFFSCQEDRKFVTNYIVPDYRDISLCETEDSLYLKLMGNTYNSIRSVNYFSVGNGDYIGLYDKMSVSYNIYDLNSQLLVNRIKLDSSIRHKDLSKHTTVFCENFDSLCLISELTMYLLDRSHTVKDTIDFQTDPVMVFGSFGTGTPPLILKDKIYLSATPFLSRRKKKDIKKWRVLYEIDMKTKETNLLFKLPQRYQDSLYGYYFFGSSYCLNNKGRVVFSFPADTNIYESDLDTSYLAYSGRSIFHKEDINAVSQDEFVGEEGAEKDFLLRVSYREIFFDPKCKMYLRIAEHHITEREYLLGKREKEKSIIFLNDNFKIIGESKVPEDILLSTIFFTKDGRMYARKKSRDEYGLHFIHLEYKEEANRNGLAAYR